VILDRKATGVCVYELQGDLYFGTMEQVFRRLAAELESVSYLILDVKRIVQIDDCARTLLAQMSDLLAKKGKKLVFAHLPHALRLALSEEQEANWTEDSFFPDTDAALEWCENQLILAERLGNLQDHTVVPLAAMDILASLSANEVERLRSIVQEVHYAAGVSIIREGDPADALFLLAAGLVSVRLRLREGTRYKRLSAIPPGVAFGELALFHGGTRSADVTADEPAICYVLSIAKLDELAILHPEIRAKLVFNIARELSARLRRADAEIRSLEE